MQVSNLLYVIIVSKQWEIYRKKSLKDPLQNSYICRKYMNSKDYEIPIETYASDF